MGINSFYFDNLKRQSVVEIIDVRNGSVPGLYRRKGQLLEAGMNFLLVLTTCGWQFFVQAIYFSHQSSISCNLVSRRCLLLC